jgi:glycosyltransferase involved in cell wall biosynthesis
VGQRGIFFKMFFDCERKILTIAISTLYFNREKLVNMLLELSLDIKHFVNFLVVSQLENEDKYFLYKGIDIYLSSDKGLSKSRNFAISKCETEWIWFQDDDIALIIEHLPALLKKLERADYELQLIRVASLENPKIGFKNYERYKINKRALSLRVSSIEMIVRTSFIKHKGIFFDENLGLGTSLPSGEENLFFYECVVRNRARYCLYPDSVCLHTTLIDTRNIDHEGRYKARGYLLRRIRSLLSLIAFIWWGVRNSNDSVKRTLRLRLMLKGFFHS